MKKLFFATLCIFAFTAVFSHPPKSVKLTYNKEDNKLTIDALHGVSNVETHYINTITIFVNDVEKEKINLTKQSSLEAENYVYKIGNLKAGDKVKVIANCNKMGKKAGEITIQ